MSKVRRRRGMRKRLPRALLLQLLMLGLGLVPSESKRRNSRESLVSQRQASLDEKGVRGKGEREGKVVDGRDVNEMHRRLRVKRELLSGMP